MNYPLNSSYKPMNWHSQTRSNLNQDGLQISKNTLINSENGETITDDSPCIGFTYKPDARTKDPYRGLQTILDQPSKVGFDGSVSDTFDIKNSKYGGIYKNYPAIQNGQITYYIDESISQPFFNPVYSLTSYVDKTIFVDPMGSHKMYYNKIPVTSSFNNMKVDQATKDEIFHREDITSRQQSLWNRSNWTARFID